MSKKKKPTKKVESKRIASPEWADAEQLNDLITDIARDSLARGESKEQYTIRLRALRDELDIHIEAAGS